MHTYLIICIILDIDKKNVKNFVSSRNIINFASKCLV